MKNIMRKLIEKYISLDVSYEKGISYFREMMDSDKDIDKLYKNIRTIYRSKLVNGTLNIKREKIKIQDRQGKLKGQAYDISKQFLLSIIATITCAYLKEPVITLMTILPLCLSIIRNTKFSRTNYITLVISLDVLNELEQTYKKIHTKTSDLV